MAVLNRPVELHPLPSRQAVQRHVLERWLGVVDADEFFQVGVFGIRSDGSCKMTFASGSLIEQLGAIDVCRHSLHEALQGNGTIQETDFDPEGEAS